MNAVEDARYQPVLEADQRADRQKGFYSGRAGYCRKNTALQLNYKNTELHTDENRGGRKKILNDFTIRLNAFQREVVPVFFQSFHRFPARNVSNTLTSR